MIRSRTLPDGSRIDYLEDAGHDRIWTRPTGRFRSENYGPWMPDTEPPIFPDQHCRGCGLEHPGEGCGLQDDLFGGGVTGR